MVNWEADGGTMGAQGGYGFLLERTQEEAQRTSVKFQALRYPVLCLNTCT